jgi:hypothetical protein
MKKLIIGLIILIFIIVNIFMNVYYDLNSDNKIILTQEEIQNLITNNSEEFEEFSELILPEYTDKLSKGEIYDNVTQISRLFKNNEKFEELATFLNCHNGTVRYDENSNIICEIIYPEKIKHYDFFIFPIYKSSTCFNITIVLEDNDKPYTIGDRYQTTNSSNIYIHSYYIAYF